MRHDVHVVKDEEITDIDALTVNNKVGVNSFF